ncbi:YciI family protein [Acinetobacter sp. MD2(2019)]|uniref:YciI family protein n=1 Tax=Acinetobacter sp. MD2(2019) TaxID=2605273 RepID=UPI002D1E98F6|nr:YciI family protein [Acinetobacter sp. MD2(2019)]MEB3753284.1 GTP cyclohydrolase [Acinetobacter sp. MD2(2019)]
MIVVTLSYKKPLADVDAVLTEHLAFLDTYYAQKKFLVSGRRENRIGGVIIVLVDSVTEAKQIMAQDPFFIHGIADYDFMRFEATKYLDEINPLI